MTVLAEVAEELGVHERTLRRGLADGLLRGWRPTPRTAELARGEAAYLRARWPMLRALREALRVQRDVRLAVLIGSVARGEERDTSDVDLLVRLTSGDWRSSERLRERLSAVVGRPVDLVAVEAAQANPVLLDDALRNGRVLVDRDGEWDAWRARGPQTARAAAHASLATRHELHELVAELSAET